ncbi:MAG: hypothetical protein RL417_1699 [Pseudomonadota bacterium]|jgi:flagellin
MVKFPSSFQSLSRDFKISKSFQRLSSGTRIASAADDPAGLSVATSLSASIASLSEASKNISYAVSRIDIADSALSQVSSLTGELQALATQAANGTLSDDQRGAIQAQYEQLTQEIQRIGATTEFNGQPVLDGSALVTQVGIDSSSSSQVATPGINLSQLAAGLTSQSLASQSSATAAIDAIAQVTQNISAAQGQLGASGARIEKVRDLNEVIKENFAASRARIVDLDVAEETARLTAQTILQNANTALSAQAGKLNASSVLNLLGGGKK